MKTITKYSAVFAAALFAFSCAPDYPTPDQNSLPQASALKPVITINQETNYVTFSIEDKGVVPVWIFGDEKIDGKTSKKYAYTQNGVTLRIRDAGTHTVELKAYNANGLSQGSQSVSFTMENTYRDPFDPTPYKKAIANTWCWDADNAGHFGCGPSGGNGLDWWSAGSHDKDAWSLYDDLMTFDVDGNYTYDPSDGQVYVNKDSNYKPEYYLNDDNDYLAPIEGYTHPYTIENNWNDAGIEEIYLVLQAGDNLSYIPNPEALTEPRYQFLETSVSSIKKNLSLVIDNGAIAWHYSLVPYVKQAGPEEFLAGSAETGKAWIMDSATAGHLGCGPDGTNPGGWWSAAPYEKEGCGLYDDVLTFFPDGSYTFDSGEGGTIYVNKDVTLIGADVNPHDNNDFQLEWAEQRSTYTFDGETLKLPEGVVIGYVPNDQAYTEATYSVTSITETQMTLVQNAAGISWQYIFKARDIKAPDVTIGGVAVEDGKVEMSLTKGQNIAVTGIDLTTYWIDPDYFEEVDANNVVFTAESGDYRIYNFTSPNWLKVIPMADGEPATYDNGGAIWIIGEGLAKPQDGKAPGWTTDASVDIPLAKVGANKYQVTVYVTGPNFKFFGQPNWGKEWGGTDYGTVDLGGYFTINGYPGGADSDSGNIWSGDSFAEGWYQFSVTDNDGVLDITCKPYVKTTTYYDIAGETNLWRSATITPEFWYANADWSQIDNPEYEIRENNGFYVVTTTEVGGTRWQAQNKLHSGISTSSDKIYDFCCTIVAKNDAAVTVKLTGNPEDENDCHMFFYEETLNLSAGEACTLKKAKVSQPVGNDDCTLIFDFGMAPDNEFTVTDICLQEHLEK